MFQFPCLESGDNNKTNFLWWLWAFNDLNIQNSAWPVCWLLINTHWCQNRQVHFLSLFSLLEGSPLPLHLLGFCILQKSMLLRASDTSFILPLSFCLVCCQFSVHAWRIVWSSLWAPWNWPVPCLSLYFPSCQVLHGLKDPVKVVLHKCLLIDKLTNMHPLLPLPGEENFPHYFRFLKRK